MHYLSNCLKCQHFWPDAIGRQNIEHSFPVKLIVCLDLVEGKGVMETDSVIITVSLWRRTMISHLNCSGTLPCSQIAFINLTLRRHLSPGPRSHSSSSSRMVSRSHNLMFLAFSPDAPAVHLFRSPLTTDWNSLSLGRPSGISALSK